MDSTAEQTSAGRGEAHDEADALAAEEWLRSAQVAALFRVHPRTVIRWSDAGRLPYVVTLGGQRRFLKAQVQALLARRRGQVPEEPGELLRTGEVARRLRVPPRTVARWSRQGRLASVRTLGGHRRYSEAEVDRLLDQPGEPPLGQGRRRHDRPSHRAARSSKGGDRMHRQLPGRRPSARSPWATRLGLSPAGRFVDRSTRES